MTEALAALPPVINQTTAPVPLDVWSAAGFAGTALASGFLAFRKSPWMAGVLAFSVPFAAYRDVAHTTITLEKAVTLGTAIGLLLGGASPWPGSRGPRRIMMASAFMLAAIALSSLGASFPMHVAREFFKQAEYVVLLWCAATFVERIPRSPLYMVGGVAVASIIVSTLAVSQAIAGGAPSGIWVNGHALPRVAGTLEGPNQLAGFLEAVLPVLWVWPLVTLAFLPARRYATFASSGALVLSQSRAGIAVGALAFAALWRLRRSVATTAAGPTIAGAVFGLVVVAAWFMLVAHARFTDLWHMFFLDIPGQQGGGVGTRAQLWPAAWKMFTAHALTGVGAGNFELLLSSAGLVGVQTQAASLPLQTLAEQGIVGFFALVVFAVVALRETFRMEAFSPLGLAAFLAFGALLTHQLVDDLFFFPKAAELCYLLLGAGSAQPAES